MTPCDYLLLTALDDEAAALSWALHEVGASGPSRDRTPGSPTHFLWQLKHHRGQLTIATASLLDMGNEAAGEYTRQLLKALEPTYLGFIGIAGASQDDVQAGAILLADKVWNYEPAKLKPRKVEHRGATHTSGRLLLDRLKYLDRELLQRLFPSLGPWPAPIIGTIASGEKVVAEADARDRLRDAGRNVVGFEMEGHQFAAVVGRALGSDHWFMVRGVQDAANRAKTDEHRHLACRRAAGYAVAFLLDSDLCIPAAGDATTPPAPGTSAAEHDDTVAKFARDAAGRLSEIDPQALLDLLSKHPLREAIGWCTIEATAAWRARQPVQCQQATAPFVTRITARRKQLTDEEATLLRLASWADWKCGAAGRAREILDDNLQHVANIAERGRWADLLASIRRHDPTDDWLAAVAMYQQALSLKQASNDPLGVAMSLQNIAFTYIEWLDLEHAKYYFGRLLAHVAAATYAGAKLSTCLAHLAVAWIEVMHGRAADLGAAKGHLQLAGQILATTYGAFPNDLRRTAKALALAVKECSGARPTLPRDPERSFWARLVIAQVRATRGTSVAELRQYVLQPESEPLLPPHRIESLLNFAARGYAAAEPPAGAKNWNPDPTVVWPLRSWLARDPSDSLEAIRLLEAIAHLYASVLAGVTGGEAVISHNGLGASARFVSEWAASNREHRLAAEALIVGSVLQSVARARNALVHSTPTEPTEPAKQKLLAAAGRLATEMTHLLRASWISRNPPVLGIAGLEVSMSHAFSADQSGLLTFRVGRLTLAVEQPEGETTQDGPTS